MKIEITQGCTADAFTVDGKPINLISDEMLLGILNRMARTISYQYRELDLPYEQRSGLENILQRMVEAFPDKIEHSEEPCEFCGDYVEIYTKNI